MKYNPIVYRLYIQVGRQRYYVRDVIVADGTEHYVLDNDTQYAMTFEKLDAAINYRTRMKQQGYDPHID